MAVRDALLVFVLLAVLQNVMGDEQMTGNVEVIQEGGILNLTCDGMMLEWTFNGTMFNVSDEGSGIVWRTLDVVIKNLTYPDHEGIYICKSSNQTVVNTTLIIAVPPEIDLTGSPNLVASGEDITLTCNVTKGNPKNYTYTWMRDKMILVNETRSTLNFTSLKAGEVVDYLCYVSNGFNNGTDNLTITVGVPPEVVLTASLNPVAVGNDVTLTCNVTRGNPMNYTYNWMHNETIVNETMRTLSINSIKDEEVGNYSCSVYNGFQPNGTSSLTITFGVPPEVVLTASLNPVAVGNDVTLTCNVTRGNPMNYTYNWMHNKTIVNETMRTLSINSIKDEEVGNYSCSVYNGFQPNGRSSLTITLGVPPEVVLTASLNPVAVGNDVTLTCNVTRGNPMNYTYNWMHNETIVNETMRTLSINSIKDEEVGNYSCSVYNGFQPNGTSSLTITFGVPPEVVLTASLNPVAVGNDVTLTCNVTRGNPMNYTYNWMHNKTIVNETMRTLSINSIKDEEVGNYSCSVYNGFQPNGRSSLTITLGVPPEVVLTASLNPVAVGNDVTLTCNVTRGNPMNYTYNWMHNETIVNETMRTLSINSIKDEEVGNYSCSVYNGFQPNGTSSLTITLGVPPEVVLTASLNPVAVGNDVTLTCNVTRGNPMNYTYNWMHNEAIVNETMRTLSIISIKDEEVGTYSCSVNNGFQPNGTNSLTITLGVAPSVSLAAGQIRTELEAGNNLTLSVNITRFNAPLTSITWNYSGNILTDAINSPSLESPPVVSSLQLTSLTPQDIGYYVVTAVNKFGSDDVTFEVNVLGPVDITDYSDDENMEFNEGDTALLSCTARGFPRPNITWSPGPDSSRTVSTSENVDEEGFEVITSNISITNIQRDDLSYICNASNYLDYETRSFSLTVNFAPIVVNLTRETEIPVGTTLSLSANITTYNLPLTNITWFFNETITIDEEDRINLTIPSFSVQGSVISSLQRTSVIPVDSGEYKLIASNPAGSSELSISVTVTAPARITEPSEDTAIDTDLESETTLRCVARGIPPPTIVWSSATGNISSMPSSSPTVDNEQYEVVTSDLTIGSIQRTDRMFTCSASNSGGMQNRSFILTVNFPPTNVIITESSLQVLSPNAINLSCSAESHPSPSFVWIRVTSNGSETLFNTSTMQGSNSFTVMNSDATSVFTISPTTAIDTATYVCIANNRLGNSTSNATVNVYERPRIVYPSDEQIFIVHEQTEITLTCIATGSPAPSISFFYKNKNVDDDDVFDDRVMLGNESTFTNSSGLYVVIRNFTLTNSMDEDSGIIVCSVSADIPSTGRMVANTSITLTVYVAAKITNSPSPQVVTSPGVATLTCTASGLPTPNITWTNPDGVADTSNITITDTVTNRQVMSTLRISSTSPSVSGTYYCNTSNGVSIPEVVTSVPALLIVHVVPEITSYLPAGSSRYVVNVTYDIVFQCTATGVPPPDIQWCRGNVRLNSSTSSRYVVRDGSVSMSERSLAMVTNYLVINDTEESDAGNNYTCKAHNMADNGMDMETFELFVQVPPVLVSSSNESTGIVRGNLTISFIIQTAIPAVSMDNIQWFYSDSQNINKDNISREDITNVSNRIGMSYLTFSSDKLSLTISNIVQAIGSQRETDQGRYFITVSNPAGNDEAFTDVIIEGPPQIDDAPVNQTVLENEHAVFNCGALADPIHSFYWTYLNVTNNSTTNISQNSGIYLVTNGPNTSSLNISSVKYSDRGIYSCTAINKVGAVSAGAQLEVHVPPVVLNISTPSEVRITHSSTIFCQVSGNILPSVTWRKNGTVITKDHSNVNISTFTNQSPVSVGDNFLVDTDIPYLISRLHFKSVSRGDTSNYTCSASVLLVGGKNHMDSSKPVHLTVLERPDPPLNIQALNGTNDSFIVKWKNNFYGNSPYLYFILTIGSPIPSLSGTFTRNVSATNSDNSVTRYAMVVGEMGDVLPYTNYSAVVSGCNRIGCSDNSSKSNLILTEEYTSSPPRNVKIVNTSKNSFAIQWKFPESPNGVIREFIVFYTGLKPYNESFKDEGNASFQCTTGSCLDDLRSLVPQTVYNITIAAVNGAKDNDGMGLHSDQQSNITLSAPPPPPPPLPSTGPEPLSESVLTHTIRLPNFSTQNGRISHYQVIVIILPKPDYLIFDTPDKKYNSLSRFDGYDDKICSRAKTQPIAYISSEFGHDQLPATNLFVIGEGQGANSPNDRTNIYENWPLCYDTSYTFFVRAYTSTSLQTSTGRAVRQADNRQYIQFTSSDYYPSITVERAPLNIFLLIIVAGSILLLILSIIIVGCIILIIKKGAAKKSGSYEPNFHLAKIDNGLSAMAYSPPHQQAKVRDPIPVKVLSAHLETMHLNENCGFIEEYKIIQEGAPSKVSSVFEKSENKSRNRYLNIECFDVTRVNLKPVEGSPHDYVNANFIDGYNRPKEYIASQGPLEATVADFWRIVWDYDVPSIVMLTNLVEKGKDKCYKYWPDLEPETYAHFVVTPMNTVTLPDFVIRQFEVKNLLTNELKKTHQFHFVSWPDHGVPRYATPLLYFLEKIRNHHKYSDARPIIVHCSAGVGRTGTLITIDEELQRAECDEYIDAFNYVKRLREQRNFMVQTDTQYVFLHDAVFEGIISGKTEVPAKELSRRIHKLREVDEDEDSGYKKEFQLLRQFKVNVSDFTDANSDNNKFKNRVTNAIPYNHNRVTLMMKPGIGGSDYINASYVDGYSKKEAMIATQGPLPNTKEDFWRMIWEKSIRVIVMLTKVKEREEEVCAQYWPSSSDCPEKIGDFKIDLMEEKRYQDFTIRDMSVSKNDAVHEVRQFHFTTWPEHGAPISGAGMLDLIDQVTKRQQQTGDMPIVIHCSAGIGRTGVFCCLFNALDRVKAEGTVDVFYTVKHLRTQRPHMVQSEVQYTFCYQTLLEFVDSLSNYSNFQ